MPEWTHWRKNVDLDAYDERWKQMAESGENPHGEADFVEDVLAGMRPASVLDAGCGTGRVGIELAGRDIDVVGVDLDEDLLDRARAKSPDLTWVHADLAGLDLDRTFDVVALAGNVIPYVAEADRAAAVAGCARHVGGSGRLVAGFQLAGGWPTIAEYDSWCAAAGLELEDLGRAALRPRRDLRRLRPPLARAGHGARRASRRTRRRLVLPSLSDLLGLRSASAGDRRAFELLVRECQGPIRRYLRHLLGDDARADVLTEDVLVEVHAQRRAYGVREPVRADRPWRRAARHHARGLRGARVSLAVTAPPPERAGAAARSAGRSRATRAWPDSR